MRRIIVSVSLLFSLSMSGLVWAQDSGSATETGGDSGNRRRVRKVDLDIDDLKISGQIQKPQVQFLLSREQIQDVSPVDMNESFLYRIEKSVDEEPF